MKWLYLALLVLWTTFSDAREEAKGGVALQKVTIGVYLMSVSKLDFVKKTYKLSAYVWGIHKTPTYRPENSVEIINAEQYTYDKPVTDKVDGHIRTQAHIHGK